MNNPPERKYPHASPKPKASKPKASKKQKEDPPNSSPSKHKKKKDSRQLPAFVVERMAFWDKLHEERQSAELPQHDIQVAIRPIDKSIKVQAKDALPINIAKVHFADEYKQFVVAKVNGQLHDLCKALDQDCEIEFLKFESPEAKQVFWHSSAHVLGQALEVLFGVLLCKGPPLENGGFYYDVFSEDHKFSQDDYPLIEEEMRAIKKAKQPFQRMAISKDEALQMFAYNRFKVDIIRKKVPDGASCLVYRCGPLIDLCRGPHVPNSSFIDACAILKNSSAIWKRGESNEEEKADEESLQRVYGVSFPKKAELEEYLKIQDSLKNRDHRKLGMEQDLFFFHSLSSGSAFFQPHGARIYNKLMEVLKEQYWQQGYEEVISPNMYNCELWKVSGHYDNYRDDMFLFQIDDAEYGLKPMNCPGHCLVFKHRIHSYRELPIRMADFGVIHRNESSGSLSGLSRVRRFQVDDAHIFCREDQIKEEIGNVLEFVKWLYDIFGFEFELQLSSRPEKFLGEIQDWDHAEDALAQALDEFGMPWSINPGDGAFYGPKIDIKVYDALKRKWQGATVQLDFQMPKRFDLQYKAGEEFKRPVIIHRAILGSFERMIAILCEHFVGKWPLWLSPRQILVVPVSAQHVEYALHVKAVLHRHHFYVDADVSNKKLNKKI